MAPSEGSHLRDCSISRFILTIFPSLTRATDAYQGAREPLNYSFLARQGSSWCLLTRRARKPSNVVFFVHTRENREMNLIKLRAPLSVPSQACPPSGRHCHGGATAFP